MFLQTTFEYPAPKHPSDKSLKCMCLFSVCFLANPLLHRPNLSYCPLQRSQKISSTIPLTVSHVVVRRTTYVQEDNSASTISVIKYKGNGGKNKKICIG